MTSQLQAIGAYYDGRDVVSWTRRPDGVREWRKARAEHACYLRTKDVTPDLASWFRRSNFIAGAREEGKWTRVAFRERDHLYQCCSDRVRIPGSKTTGPGFFPGKGIATFEADLHPVRRWALENKVAVALPRRGYVDFEADSRHKLTHDNRDVVFTKTRLLSWTLGDDEGNYVQGILEADTDEAERELILDLLFEMERYDQIVGWYSDEYDLPLLETRLRVLRMREELRRWLWVDYLPVFERMNMTASKSGDEKQSMSLDSVARATAGVSKLEGVTGAVTWQLWSEDVEFLAGLYERAPHLRGLTGQQILLLYNQGDVYAMVAIESKKGYLDLHNTLSQATGVFPDTAAANPLRFVDNFILNFAHDRGERLPSCFGRPPRGTDTTAFEGAYVQEPRRIGFIENVHVADFAAMYPSIIQTWNISPDTLVDVVLREDVSARPSYLAHVPVETRERPPGTCETPNGTVYRTDEKGMLVLCVEKLIELRSYWNKKKAEAVPGSAEYDEADNRATAYKQSTNSFYGVVGCPFFRLYSRRVAESIPTAGQWMIKQVLELGEQRGIEGLYCDTDSNFGVGADEERFGAFVKWLNADYFPSAVAKLGTVRCELKLAYEKAFELLVMVGKKRYAGRYLHYKGSRATEDSKPEVKGLEYKRGDAPKLARRLQSEALDRMLGGGVLTPKRRPTYDLSVETYVRLIDEWIERVMKGPLELADVLKAQGLNQELDDYAQKLKKDGTPAAQPAHVQIAKQLRERGIELDPGAKVEYFVIDGSKDVVDNLVCAWAGDWKGECDRYYLWDDVVFPPTQRLLEACFPEVNWKDRLQRPRWKKACKDVDRFVRQLQADYDKAVKRGYNPNQQALF